MTFTNFFVGLPVTLLCLIAQAATAFWSVRYFMRHIGEIQDADRLLRCIRPLLTAMLVMMLGNLVQISLWGALFVLLGEFDAMYPAIYHSAVNFSSLGYGDVVMSNKWKLLGPLEAVNGVLMLGMSAAALMAILQEVIRVQRVRAERTIAQSTK
ncbi:MAG: ion channel [Steroidobacteraceae bacterium]